MTDWHFRSNEAQPMTVEEVLGLFMDLRPAWHIKAECRHATDTMFADKSGGWESNWVDARAVCARCPVIKQCGAYALDADELYGMWGGMTPKERRKVKRGNQ